jgi:hypothetical protein
VKIQSTGKQLYLFCPRLLWILFWIEEFGTLLVVGRWDLSDRCCVTVLADEWLPYANLDQAADRKRICLLPI